MRDFSKRRLEVRQVTKCIKFVAGVVMAQIAMFGCQTGRAEPQFTWKQYGDLRMAGWSDEKLKSAWDYGEELGSASVMVAYKGKVLLAWGDWERNYNCHSIRKVFLNALIGIYVDNGVIDLGKTLGDLDIDDNTPLTDVEKQATVEQLLQSRSGVYLRAMGDGSSMVANKPKRGSHRPGEAYHYNNWGFNALGTIFQQTTGKDVFDEFLERIAIPIGMEDFTLENTEWRTADFTRHRYYSFRMSTRDLTRFGLLYLQRGRWQEKSILSEDWITRSTRAYSDAGIGGYGYLWKTFSKGELLDYGFQSLADHDIFWVSGISVHVLAVVPDMDLVFVHRYDSDNGIPDYELLPVFKLLDMIVAARVTPSVPEPLLVNVNAVPYSAERKPVVKPTAIHLSQDALDNYVGTYYLPPVTIRIAANGDHLQHVEADGSVFDNLYPEAESLFFYEHWDRKIEFEADANGRITSYYLICKGVRQKAARIE